MNDPTKVNGAPYTRRALRAMARQIAAVMYGRGHTVGSDVVLRPGNAIWPDEIEIDVRRPDGRLSAPLLFRP